MENSNDIIWIMGSSVVTIEDHISDHDKIVLGKKTT
jgi:hypothetical protein